MKTPRIGLSLDKPCTQSWPEMTPVQRTPHGDERGRYCDSCRKSVIDFTNMTDNELLEFIRKNGEGFCGMFRASQLNRPFVETKLNGKSSRLNSFLAGLTIAGATGSLGAQTTTTPTYTPVVVIDEKHPTGAVCIRQQKPTTDTSDLVVHITVMDTTNNEPMPFAVVYIPGTSLGVQTDTAGKATLIIPYEKLADSTITLTAKNTGYFQKSIVIDTRQRDQQVTFRFSDYDFPMLGGPMLMIEDPKPDKKKKK